MIVEKLTALFDLDATGFNAGMEKAKKNLDSASESMKKTTMESNTMGSSFSSTATTISIAAAAVAAFGAATFAATVKLAEMSAEIDALERGLKFVSGGARQGREAFKFLVETSDRLGVSIEKSAKSFQLMSAAAMGSELAAEDVREIYLAIAEASAVVGLSQQQMELAMFAVQQMMSKGVITAEELNRQLREQLPIAADAMSKALGVSTGELSDLVKTGTLASEDVLPAFAKQMRESVAESVEDASKSMRASLARMSNAWYLAKREMLSGITETGLQKAVEGITEAVKELPRYWRYVEIGVYGVLKVTAMLFKLVNDTWNLFIDLTTQLVVHLRNVSNAIFSFLISPFTEAKKQMDEWGAETPKSVTAVTESLKNLGKTVSNLLDLPSFADKVLGEGEGVGADKIEKNIDAVKKRFEEKFSDLKVQLEFERLEAEAATEFEKAELLIEKRLQLRTQKIEDTYKKTLLSLANNKEKELALTQSYNELIANVQLTADKQLQAARIMQMEAQQREIDRLFERNYKSVISFVESSVKKFTDTLVDLSMGGKKSFKEMVDSIIADMQKLVYQIFVIEPIIKAFRDLLQKAVPTGEGLLGIFSGEGKGGSLISNLFGAAKNIFGFGSGGTIREPVAGIGLATGSGYMIGESGPETITPAGDIPGNVVVNISAIDSKSLVDTMQTNPQAILSPLVDALQSGDRGVSSALRGAI